MAERLLAALLVDVAQKIEVEEILPRLAAQRARLDLRQAQVAQGEGAEAAEQRTRLRRRLSIAAAIRAEHAQEVGEFGQWPSAFWQRSSSTWPRKSR